MVGLESIFILVKVEIDGLCLGRIEDVYNWVVFVDLLVLINM